MSRSSSVSRTSALLLACEEEDLDQVSRLATFQLVNTKNDVLPRQVGYSSLALAVKAGNEQLVNLLLERGAEVNSANNVGQM
jgi:ankyrin repeat protein